MTKRGHSRNVRVCVCVCVCVRVCVRVYSTMKLKLTDYEEELKVKRSRLIIDCLLTCVTDDYECAYTAYFPPEPQKGMGGTMGCWREDGERRYVEMQMERGRRRREERREREGTREGERGEREEERRENEERERERERERKEIKSMV